MKNKNKREAIESINQYIMIIKTVKYTQNETKNLLNIERFCTAFGEGNLKQTFNDFLR